ncbi:MAG: serine/threonine protein kinase [Candidatus Riflebacteria bacterium]|nr:serine/threonine protein kinase [Candidatus Riflebacteria bacterium]
MITPGQKIGTFQVGNLIGEGATASVFHATDTKLNRPVAIKVLKEDLPESSRERFVREVKTLVEVRHAAIVHVYTAGIEGGSPYYVMEHLSGRSIKEMITHRKGKGVPVFRHDEILSIGRQLAEALGALHKARIIHRDLKPSNVMIVPPMKAKVIDFGLVQVGSGARMGERSRGLGTQAYMSPEQLEGGLIGEQSDLFQIGLILHEMVTGEQLGGHGVPPWFGKSQWNPPLPSSTDPKLPPDLEKAIVARPLRDPRPHRHRRDGGGVSRHPERPRSAGGHQGHEG